MKRLIIFSLIFLCILFWAYAGAGKIIISNFYQSQASYWFSNFGNNGEVNFKKDKNKASDYDLMVVMTSKTQKKNAIDEARALGKQETQIAPLQFPINSWSVAGLFFAFFIALLIAAPLSIKAKLVGFAFGLPILYLFVLFKLWVSLLLKFSRFNSKFQVGLENVNLVNWFDSFYNIIKYPYFGLMFSLIVFLAYFFTNQEKKKDVFNKMANT